MANTKGCDGIDPDNVGLWLPLEELIVDADFRQMPTETRVAEAEVSQPNSPNKTR